VNPANPGAASYLAEVQAAAQTLRLRTYVAAVRRPDDLDAAFASLLRERVDALLLGPEATMFAQRSHIAEFGLRHRLPVVGALRPFVEAGALMSYAPDQVFLHREAATYVDKILKGAKPADLRSATVQVPVRHQPEDRPRPRPHHPAVAAAAGGPGDRMNRRAFVTGLGAVLASSLGAAAQPAAKMPRVGLLGLGSADSSPDFEALRQGLRDLGWVHGQSISFEDRTAVGNYSQIEDVAAELVRLKVDVIVTSSTTAALAARKATKTIAIVTIVGSDPVEMGLAASLARPGGNITGLAYQSRECSQSGWSCSRRPFQDSRASQYCGTARVGRRHLRYRLQSPRPGRWGSRFDVRKCVVQKILKQSSRA